MFFDIFFVDFGVYENYRGYVRYIDVVENSFVFNQLFVEVFCLCFVDGFWNQYRLFEVVNIVLVKVYYIIFFLVNLVDLIISLFFMLGEILGWGVLMGVRFLI